MLSAQKFDRELPPENPYNKFPEEELEEDLQRFFSLYSMSDRDVEQIEHFIYGVLFFGLGTFLIVRFVFW